jgi:outer membrane protein assembly factor BamB
MISFSLQQNRTVKGLLVLSVAVMLAGCEKELILQGERFDTRAPLDASIPVEGEAPPVDTTNDFENQSVPISLAAASASADWTHRAGNAQHLMGHAALSSAPARVWSASIGKGNSRKYRISAAPVVSDGRVFAMDATGMVTAVSTGGAALWRAELKPQAARSDVSGGGLAIGAGRLFATTGYGELVALDMASGAVVWRQKLGAPAAAAPTVSGSAVYVTGRNGAAKALNATDGRLLWEITATRSNSGMLGAGSPAIAGSSVLFPSGSGEILAAAQADGAGIWRAAVAGKRLGRSYAGITEITGDPVIAGNTAYIGNQSGNTAAIDVETGGRLWTAKEAAYGPVLAAGGSIFLVSDEAKLVRLDAATGAKIWSVEMPYYTREREKSRARITAHFGPVLAGGRLVVASGDGTLRMFNPQDGALTGTVDLPGGAASLPALAGGVLYVVSGNGQLHAFR